MTQQSIQTIQYSDQSIRWCYGDNTRANQANLSQITKWWMSLHGKSVELRSITGIKKDSQGNWQPIQQNIEIFQIQNPQIVDNNLIFDGFSKMSSIETVALDFDPDENQFVVHLPATQITENPYTQPKTVLRENHKKYIFTLSQV
jgi:hypothetical protein